MTEPIAPVPPPPTSPPSGAWAAPPLEPGPAPGVAFAPHGARLLSYLLDCLILFIVLAVFWVIVLAAGTAAGTGGALAGFGILLVGTIAVSIGYWPWFWMRGGQTPGMKPFGLFVVDDRTGGPVSGGAAALRYLGYIINGIALYIGFAWVLVDKRRRGWHDLIAGTVVIKR